MPLNCGDCGSTGSVVRGFCEVCYADTGERGPGGGEPAGLPPAALPPAALPPAALPPARRPPAELRFTDVVEELGAIARLAQSVDDGEMLAAACRRAERLLGELRGQFLMDLGLHDGNGRPNGSPVLASN